MYIFFDAIRQKDPVYIQNEQKLYIFPEIDIFRYTHAISAVFSHDEAVLNAPLIRRA